MSEPQNIDLDDTVVRCAIHPQISGGIEKVFDYTWLLYFRGKGPKRVISVGWRKWLKTDSEVHKYGCRTAAISNERKLEQDGIEPKPLEGRSHYLGFYSISINNARSASNEIYKVDFEHVPEKGQVAHGHIFYEERAGIGNTVNKGAARTAIVIKLWAMMSGPVRHICEIDKAYENELFAIELRTPSSKE